MKPVLTDRALADLGDIADWIGRDDPDRAETFVLRLREKCESLSSHPRRCPLVAGAAQADLRKLTYRDYLIFYRVRKRQVEVVRIVHGSRDWVALFREGE